MYTKFNRKKLELRFDSEYQTALAYLDNKNKKSYHHLTQYTVN
jgi:hypothetical protein